MQKAKTSISINVNFLNAIEKKMNRKRLKLLSFLNFLLAVDSTQLVQINLYV